MAGNHLRRRTMEGKTVLIALVTGTVTPKDAKDSEVSCSSFLDLTSSCLKTERENGNKSSQSF